MKKSNRIYLCLFLIMIGVFFVSMQTQASCELPVTTHAENIDELTSLLPGDARGALAVDINTLLSGSSATEITGLLNGEGSDAALNEPFSAIHELAENIDLAGVMKRFWHRQRMLQRVFFYLPN